MVDWAPEAIEAAHLAMFQEPYDGTTAALIGAGLDAAAAAQGIKDEEITRLREENARLREVLQECADDLEDVINGQYGEIGKKAMPDRYKRDMQPVIRARAAILGDVKAEAACPELDEAP